MDSKWELVYVDGDVCDICGSLASLNIYRKLVGVKLYRFIGVCAYCLDGWIKNQKQFEVD